MLDLFVLFRRLKFNLIGCWWIIGEFLKFFFIFFFLEILVNSKGGFWVMDFFINCFLFFIFVRGFFWFWLVYFKIIDFFVNFLLRIFGFVNKVLFKCVWYLLGIKVVFILYLLILKLVFFDLVCKVIFCSLIGFGWVFILFNILDIGERLLLFVNKNFNIISLIF